MAAATSSTTAAFRSLFTLALRSAVTASKSPHAGGLGEAGGRLLELHPPPAYGRRGSRAKSSDRSVYAAAAASLSSGPAIPRVTAGSTRTPGPIVVASVIVRR